LQYRIEKAMVKHFRKILLARRSNRRGKPLRGFSLSRRLVIAVPLLALVLAVVSGLLYAQNSDRAKKIGGGLMCMCNCNQILTQCNHVGCTMSAKMIKELDERVQGSGSDDLIVQSFVQEFGPKVLASPPTSGFNLVAWFIPGIAFGAGLALVIVVIRHWRKRMELTPAAAGGPAVSPEFMERARRQADRETEE
jgi:cytochrome c-type biogenesis protein CcmH